MALNTDTPHPIKPEASSFSMRRWQVAPALSDAEYSPFRGMNRILASVLYRRGLKDHRSATQFLKGEMPLADPFRMMGVRKAVERIRGAIRKQELIVVYGDFDADGVTSTTVLTSALRALGANVRSYIPNRVDEGYGLNTDALSRLRRAGAQLVITVDCGIRSIAEVDYGVKTCGLDMIVTDHHSVGDEIPGGIVINPKQPGCEYGEDMLAGVGVTYRLAAALFMAASQNGSKAKPTFEIEDLLDLVAIGTVADLVPLEHPENRVLVMQGLERIRHEPRPGIRALLEVSDTQTASVDATAIGFRIAPRINAAGRLKSADIALKLLLSTRYEEALPYAHELQTLNAKRQDLTRQAQEFAIEQIGDPAQNPLIFASSADFPPGIVGLVAGRLTEAYHRPSVIVQKGEDESHGSCRSPEGFHITEALDECADLLTRHGGHAQAAGFSLPTENLDRFRERLWDVVAQRLDPEQMIPTQPIDAIISLTDINQDLIAELKRLEPTGHGNPSPVLGTRRIRVRDRRRMGKEGDHLKLRLTEGLFEIEAVGWRMGSLVDSLPEWVDIAYQPELNEWQGDSRIQLVLQDIQPST